MNNKDENVYLISSIFLIRSRLSMRVEIIKETSESVLK